jgi:membrane fusion protein (multidrug efflux system)
MSANNNTESAPNKKNKVFPIILAALVIGGLWFGLTKYFHGQKHEETEDAQIEANISPVISKIPGYVKKVFVKDNQFVNKGDTLLLIDDRDLQITFKQSEAALATAQSNLSLAEANSNAASQNIHITDAAIATADAQIESAKVAVWRSSEELKRYENLIQDHSVTKQQYEQVLAAKQLADRQLQVSINQRNQAKTQTGVVVSQTSAVAQQIGVATSIMKQKMVDVENAKLNLSYTVITAHETGLVSKVPLQEGQFLQAGQLLFSVVLNSDKWVVANFKETQYNKMAEGQKVIIHADAFPDHNFMGVLSSFSPATGSKFALLPPDNASGNFVKVVQRLPIKIEFTDKADTLIHRLRAGMNVFVDVHVGE